MRVIAGASRWLDAKPVSGRSEAASATPVVSAAARCSWSLMVASPSVFGTGRRAGLRELGNPGCTPKRRSQKDFLACIHSPRCSVWRRRAKQIRRDRSAFRAWRNEVEQGLDGGTEGASEHESQLHGGDEHPVFHGV